MTLVTLREVAEDLGLEVQTIRSRAVRNGIKPVAYKAINGSRTGLYEWDKILAAPSRVRRAEYVLDDAMWMAGDGIGATEAYQRLGYKSWDSLYNLLRRAGRLDVAAKLAANQGHRPGR